MIEDDGRPVTTNRRRQWGGEPQRVSLRDATLEEFRSPDETRRDAKRLLWRDASIILVWIVLAVFVLNYLPGMAPVLLADQTDSPPGATAAPPADPGGSMPPGATFGPVVDPGLGLDATPRPPSVTLPPTGTSRPVEPGATPARPTPRPTRKPPATIAPVTPPPTAAPPPPTEPAPTQPPPPTEPPPTEPPQTDPPT